MTSTAWEFMLPKLKINLVWHHTQRFIDFLQVITKKISCSLDTLVESFYSVNYVNVNYSVKYTTVDCNYLLFLQDFFFRLKAKQYKKYQYCRLFKKHLETRTQNKLFDGVERVGLNHQYFELLLKYYFICFRILDCCDSGSYGVAFHAVVLLCLVHVVVKIFKREEESLASSLLNILCYQNWYQLFYHYMDQA